MRALSDRCADAGDALERVTVVDDQVGRLTFTETMAGAIFHLLGYREGDMEPTAPAPYGLYNCTNSGDAASWAKIAAAVFDRANGNGGRVVPVSTADYYANAAGPIAPRPEHSALDLSKLDATALRPQTGTRNSTCIWTSCWLSKLFLILVKLACTFNLREYAIPVVSLIAYKACFRFLLKGEGAQ